MRRRRPAMNSVGSIGCRRSAFEQRFCDRTVARLGVQCAERLEELADRPLLAELKADPGQVGRETLLREIDKLTAIRSLRLSPDLFADTSLRIATGSAPAGRAIRLNVADQIATG
jgi:stage III sporulation protein SpoIIIAA